MLILNTKKKVLELILISISKGKFDIDVDSGPWGPCVEVAMDKFTQTIEILWRQGTAWPLSE